MPLTPGARLGSFEVVAQIGSGGMGEVYHARDTKLGRDVAIKVLPDLYASDPDRLARFQREAQVLASLNHPNIAAIYGLEESPSPGPGQAAAIALVLELVPGETLAARIVRGPIPLDEAMPIARQIADALEAAHEQGIIHRDLKPANIKVTPDGTVKVLDFGLAKLHDSGASNVANASLSPTITSPALMTGVGVLLGTAAYMSPEQARGRAVDKRADIWAFGAVLYEMVTGRQAFAGEDVGETLAKIIQSEPRWDDVPRTIRPALQKCLAKDPRKRLRDIGDVWAIVDAAEQPIPVAPARRRGTLPWAIAALAILVAVAALWALRRPTGEALRPLVTLDVDLGSDVMLPPNDRGRTVAISPDGTRIAYVARVGDQPRRLYTRRLDQLEQPRPTALEGTDDASSPMFSPDGQWIAFLSNGVLSKVSIAGRVVVPLARDLPNFAGAAWDADGTIVIGHALTAGMTRVNPNGGAEKTILPLATGDLAFRSPAVLPGGIGVLFAYAGSDRGSDVQALSAGGRRTILAQGGASPRYVPSGHLLYATRGTLFAVPLDLSTLETRGTPMPMVSGVATDARSGGDYDVSATGTLIYRSGTRSAAQLTTLAIITGSSTRRLQLKPDTYFGPRLSPDGTRLAYAVSSGSNAGVWIYDLMRDIATKLPRAPNARPLWTPDGQHLVFGSLEGRMLWIRADGSGESQVLFQWRGLQSPGSFSRDGTLAFSDITTGVLPRVHFAMVTADAGQLKGSVVPDQNGDALVGSSPMFSPDGKWIAYSSVESGQTEVYVGPAPGAGAGSRLQVSSGGGQSPVWRRDRNELLYRSGDAIMSVSYRVNGGAFVADRPITWMRQVPPQSAGDWDLSADGKGVIVAAPFSTETVAPKPEHMIVFVQNFFDELKRRVLVR